MGFIMRPHGLKGEVVLALDPQAPQDLASVKTLFVEVTDTTLGSLGKITGVIQAGPNKLLAIDYGGREVLIPVNSPFIDAINKSKKQLTVTLPEGFVDI